RKKKLPILHIDDPMAYSHSFRAEIWENDLLVLVCENPEVIKPYKKLLVLFNNSAVDKHYQFNDYYVYLSAKDTDEKTLTYVKNGVIGASTILIYFQKDETK
ncbi:MAG: hypothetical protein K6F07_00860, partial [Bacilli bacterium]|nr:hypothetical protein [Bacilli bacterium]